MPGLYFIVQPTGKRSWAARYRFNGKPCTLTIGAYPAIDLKAARDLARAALAKVAGGIELEKLWIDAVARDPLRSTYGKCKDKTLGGKEVRGKCKDKLIHTHTLGGKEVREALEFMFEATGDVAFRTAALTMTAYQFDKGSIKTQALNIIDGDHAARSLWYAMGRVYSWLVNEITGAA